MSDKWTTVKVLGKHITAERGHMSYDEVIRATELHYQERLRDAYDVINALHGSEVEVFHQTGIYRPKNRKKVKRDV